MSKEQKNVTMKGEPVTLIGNPVEVGSDAPDFIVFDQDLSAVPFSSINGAPCIISSVVSLDTPVCDKQARRFNEEALELSADLKIYVISMDLPFAQQRWCGAANADRVQTFSDYRDASFGTSYGVLIKDLRLLARSVFVIDSDSIVRYQEIVSEVTDHPDYDKLFEAVRSVL
jgi:thiol peroxidase